MEIIDRVRSLAKILLTRLALHGQLIGVEWAEEKQRLQQLMVISVFGCIFLFCAILFMGFFAIAVTWDSDYRLCTIAAMLAVYTFGFGVCAHRVARLAARSSAAFAATREEVAADLAVLRSQL